MSMKHIKSLNATKFALKLTVSATLLYFIFNYVGISKIYHELSNSKLFYVALGISLVPLQTLFKALRWNLMISIFKSNLGLKSSLAYTLISYAFGIITPGRLGEFVKAKFLVDKKGISYKKSFATVILDKLFDVITVVLAALAGLSFINIGPFNRNFFIITLLIYSLLIAFSLLFFERIKRWAYKLLPQKYSVDLGELHMPVKLYAMSLIHSVLIWAILSLQGFFISKALYMDISFSSMLAIIPLMALSSMVPVSIGGFGIREIIAIYFFAPLGVPPEKSVLFSIINTFVSFGIPAIIGAIIYAGKKK